MSKEQKKTDFMALVAPRTKVKRLHLLNADLFRFRQVVGETLKAGVTTSGDFILYTADSSTWQKLVKILPFLVDFREQRIDPVRTKIELLEVRDEDTLLFP